MSFQEIPPLDLSSVVSRAEGILYMIADAAVAADPSPAGAADAAAQKSGSWFGFISEAMEVVLKVALLIFLVGIEIRNCCY